jgi:hypothetical protein
MPKEEEEVELGKLQTVNIVTM